MCERKRRFVARTEKHVKMGFVAFQRFFKVRMGARTPPDIEKFDASKFYIAFVKFGRWLFDNNVLNPQSYIEFLLTTGLDMKEWTSPVVYETYVRNLTRSETPACALERNIRLMEQWASESGEEWTDFFRKVSPVQAALWIRSGRLSPWMLFTASSTRTLLDRFGPEQRDIMEAAIDKGFWKLKLAHHEQEVLEIRAMLRECNL